MRQATREEATTRERGGADDKRGAHHKKQAQHKRGAPPREEQKASTREEEDKTRNKASIGERSTTNLYLFKRFLSLGDIATHALLEESVAVQDAASVGLDLKRLLQLLLCFQSARRRGSSKHLCILTCTHVASASLLPSLHTHLHTCDTTTLLSNLCHTRLF